MLNQSVLASMAVQVFGRQGVSRHVNLAESS